MIVLSLYVLIIIGLVVLSLLLIMHKSHLDTACLKGIFGVTIVFSF